MCSKLCSFPNLAFICFAVADKYEHVVVASVDLIAERRAGRSGHTLAQRTGRQVNAGGLGAVGMGRDIGVRLIERVSLLNRVKALQAKGSIHRRACMALRQYAPVAVFPAGILRIDLHHFAIQHSQCVNDGHRAANVAEAKRADRLQGLQADFLCKYAQLLHLFCFLHCIHLPNSKIFSLRGTGSVAQWQKATAIR